MAGGEMTLPTHRVSYQVEYDILEKALADEIGARIRMPSIEAATHLRARIHQARKIDRVENIKAYEEGDPMHGQSVYDKLVLRLRQANDKVYLYVEQRSAESFDIEPLSGEEEPPMEVKEVIVTETLKRRGF
jgi:hypothetical protein